MNGGSYRRFNLAAAALSMLALAAPLAFTLTPTGDGLRLFGVQKTPELCVSKRWFDRPCSTCGLGRSMVLLLHGDLAASRARHAGGVWFTGWLALQTLYRLGLVAVRASGRRWALDVALTVTTFLAVVLRVVTI